jgi:protein-disulfide isomerase
MNTQLRTLVLVALAFGCDNRAGEPLPAPAPAVARPALELYKVPLGDSPARGGAAPKVTLVAFSEFQCPFCGRVTPMLDQILKTYGDDVRLVFKHRPLPFHDRATPAALAAEAAREQGKFWEMHDKLFANQRALGAAELERYAADLGLDVARWKAASTGAGARARVDADAALADQLAVNGTPSFFINGRPLVGAQPFAAFKALIDEELARADQKLKLGVARAALYAELTRDGQVRGVAPAPRPASPPGRGDDGDDEFVKVPLGDTSGVSKGSPDALVTIVEYADFQCPFCARVEPTLDRLLDEYRGKVRLVWRDFPLAFHENATPAALAAREARAQGRFWQAHKQLMASQGVLERPLAERPGARAALDAEVAAAGKLGVRGTPTFFVNGRKVVGAQPYERFKAVIEEELKKAEALVARGTPRGRLYETLMKDARTP